MISSALMTWRGTRAARLDRLIQTRLMVNQSARWAADELDQALVLRVASEFQAFDRDLHTAVEALNTARNGLAHDDAAKIQASERAGWPVSIASAQRWRESPDGLATTMDHVVGAHLAAKFATSPWKGS